MTGAPAFAAAAERRMIGEAQIVAKPDDEEAGPPCFRDALSMSW